MTPPIHVGLAQHPKKRGRGRGLSQIRELIVIAGMVFMFYVMDYVAF